MWEFSVFTEAPVSRTQLMEFVRVWGGAVDGAERESYALEDQKKGGGHIYVSFADDPGDPELIHIASNELSKKLVDALQISVARNGYDLALSIAAQMVREWGGVAHFGENPFESTREDARRVGLPLWLGPLRDTISVVTASCVSWFEFKKCMEDSGGHVIDETRGVSGVIETDAAAVNIGLAPGSAWAENAPHPDPAHAHAGTVFRITARRTHEARALALRVSNEIKVRWGGEVDVSRV